MVPTPSTWPWTRCPPMRVARVAERSRLTGSPGRSAPSDERSSVSRITSVVKTSPSTSTTVRQTPLTAIESPCWASAVTTGPCKARRAVSPNSPGAPSGTIDATDPSSSTMPVNTSCPFHGCGEPQVRSDPRDVAHIKVDGAADGVHARRAERGRAGAEKFGGDVGHHAVDQAGPQEHAGQRGAAFEQGAAHAAAVQLLEHLLQVDRSPV